MALCRASIERVVCRMNGLGPTLGRLGMATPLESGKAGCVVN